jgi:putative transposase
MDRRRADLQNIDTSTWPTGRQHRPFPHKRDAFAARQKAVNLYTSGQTLREIERLTGINSSQLYGLLDRCLAPASDGCLFGYRGLLKHHRIRTYARTAKLATEHTASRTGLAGAFALLLEQHPPLAQWLTQRITKRAVSLHQRSTDGRIKTRLSGLGNLHRGSLAQCRTAGITAADYPFNTDRLGLRALSVYVTAQMLADFGNAAHAAGARHLKGLPDAGRARSATRPYQVVEFDGHRLDVRLKIVLRDPLGFEQEFEIERIWLLVIIDVCTRAVLGYHLVLSREYSCYDVIKTIEQALTPHRPRSFSLHGVGYGPHGGFPSGKLPELGYAIWERMRFDNAKANLASEVLAALCEFVGCAAVQSRPSLAGLFNVGDHLGAEATQSCVLAFRPQRFVLSGQHQQCSCLGQRVFLTP